MKFKDVSFAEPECTSKRFGPKMYCFSDDGGKTCKYCGSPITPITVEQKTLIEAGNHETWWKRSDE